MRYYQVRYGGCNHNGVLSETQLRTGAKGQELDPDTTMMIKVDLFTCNACLNMEPGYSSDSVLHPIISARMLSPLELYQSGFAV
jgi:hypothetical protein